MKTQLPIIFSVRAWCHVCKDQIHTTMKIEDEGTMDGIKAITVSCPKCNSSFGMSFEVAIADD